jgi:hypothetical protein
MSILRKKLENQIIEKAMKDDSFRMQLLKDPKNTFERETGITLPGSLTVHVLQEDQETVYLVLPAVRSEAADGELTESELASVAGGDGLWGTVQPGT